MNNYRNFYRYYIFHKGILPFRGLIKSKHIVRSINKEIISSFIIKVNNEFD